jgi:amino acid transporter
VALLGAVGVESLVSGATGENTAVAVAVTLLAIVWIAQRRGRMISSQAASRAVVGGLAVLVVTMTWAALTAIRRGGTLAPLPFSTNAPTSVVGALVALGAVLFALGGVDALALVALSRAAAHSQPAAHRRAGRLHSLVITASVGFSHRRDRA